MKPETELSRWIYTWRWQTWGWPLRLASPLSLAWTWWLASKIIPSPSFWSAYSSRWPVGLSGSYVSSGLFTRPSHVPLQINLLYLYSRIRLLWAKLRCQRCKHKSPFISAGLELSLIPDMHRTIQFSKIYLGIVTKKCFFFNSQNNFCLKSKIFLIR